MGAKDNPIIFLARKTWEYSKGSRGKVILYIFLFIIANGFMFLDPLILATLLNKIQEEGISAGNIKGILFLTMLFPIVRLFFWFFHGPARVIERKNAFLVKANYKKHLIGGVMGLPMKWHSEHHSGDTIDKIEKSTNALTIYASKGFVIIESLLNLIGSYIALIYFNMHAAYIVLFVFIITIIMVVRFDRKLKKEYKRLFLMENKIAAKVYDIISNITTVIILRLEKILAKSIFRKIMHPYGLHTKNAKGNEMKWFTLNMCTASLYFVVIASYILENYWSGIPILVGTISALGGYTRRINDVVYRFAGEYGEIVRQKAAVENMEKIAENFREKKKSETVNLHSNWNVISVRKLAFSYHGSGKNGGDLHLNNVSLDIKRNEKIALVGESGSGKTTFLKLMRNLFEPRQGEVYLDGKLLPHQFGSLSENITFIPQEPEIFSTTIRENITVGIDHHDTYIGKFTDMAQFTHVVQRLPKKLESHVFERGVNLSGGEKQRLALARGFLAAADKPVLFLDEPTSSVDAKNEMIIYDAVFREFSQKTIISTVHRLHLLKRFDRVFVFEKGEIIATGSVNELLASSPEFRLLWKKYYD